MSKKRGNRRLSRELALRALYQWRLTGDDLARLLAEAEDQEEYPDANVGFLHALLEGVLAEAEVLNQALARHLDRAVDQLSPIEHSILLIGAYELSHSLDVPYKVAINEAVNLAKAYGGTDGHKYVNGVLDKLARDVRRIEIEAAAKP
jgi:N utilization substance protein B